jgi:hypothetical protein
MNNSIFTLSRAIPFLAFGMFMAGCEDTNSRPGEPASPLASRKTTAPASDEQPPKHGSSTSIVQPDTVPPVAEQSVANSKEEPKEPSASAANRTEVEEEKEIPPEKDPPIPPEFKPLNKEKTIFFEKTADDKRRVHLLAEVCQRNVMLEVFLCKNETKEHEAILHANIDAREIHMALIAAGAKPGSTVKFVPKYTPATGDVIKVSVTYYKDGKLLTKPAQSWVFDVNTKKEMQPDWVFAGSRLFKFPDEPERQPFYCANNGEVIAISNFSDSMLDLPVKSSKEEAELSFRAYTERIPPLRTKVLVTLELVKAKK